MASLTDTGYVERFIDQYGNMVRYCPEQNVWYVWSGTKWESYSVMKTWAFMFDLSEDLYDEAQRIPDEEERQRALRFASRCGRLAYVKAAARRVELDERLHVHADMIDGQKYRINLSNGVLDLTNPDDIRLIPHEETKYDYHTRIADVRYEPDAECPFWEECIDAWTESGEDAKLAHKAAGYALTGDVSEGCIFVLHGHDSCVMDAYLHTIMEILGEYAGNTAFLPRGVLWNKGDASARSIFVGRRVVEDDEDSLRWYIAKPDRLDAATGRRKMVANHIRRFEYTPQHKLFIETFGKPVIKSKDRTVLNRIKLISFPYVFPREYTMYDVSKLNERLREERSGILNWMVEGYKLWRREGLS